MKAFVSWSGGKESSLSCHKTMQAKDFEIAYLLNMAGEDGERSRSHGVSSKILKRQSESIGIPLIQRKTTWNTYEAEFKEAIREFKKEGVAAGIFGDIDIEEHRKWVDRICGEMGIVPVLPLWGMERETLLGEFISFGFRAAVVALNTEFLDESWLGRQIDKRFVEDLRKERGIDLCGERGEYHTLVYDGPGFREPVDFRVRGTEARNKHRLLILG